MNRNGRFMQPVDAIRIVYRAPIRTLLNEETIKRGMDRIAAGEDKDKVLTELAMLELTLTEGDDLRTASRHPETAVHRAADAHVSKFAVAIRYAFVRARKALGRPPNADRAAAAMKQALQDVMPKTLLNVMGAGGVLAVKVLRTAEFRAAKNEGSKSLNFQFDLKNQNAVDWADKHAAELIDGITETTREAINNAIAEGLEGDGIDSAYEDILAAIGDEDRAMLIARHETMLAASEGQRQGWDQAVEDGLLTGDEKRGWITVGDGDVCPICDELDGVTADLDGLYPGDGEDGPPAHVGCRCTEGIVS